MRYLWRLNRGLPAHPLVGDGKRVVVGHNLRDAVLFELPLDESDELITRERIEFDAMAQQELNLVIGCAVLAEVPPRCQF